MLINYLTLNGDSAVNKFIALPLISLSILLFVPGCMQENVRINSNAYADRDVIPHGFPKGTSMVIAQGGCLNEERVGAELQTKELKKKLQILLQANGFNVINPEAQINESAYFIVFTYGSEHETKTLQVAKYVNGPSEFTTGISNLLGNYSQQKTTTGSYVYVPEEHTYFTKSLTCYVFSANNLENFKQNGKAEYIWKGQTYIVNENSDLRPYLDFLLIQLMNIFGKNTMATITTSMKKDNKSVACLRNTYLDIKPKK